MRFVERIVEVFCLNARFIAAAAVVLTVVATWIASSLSLEADLERLLPETAPSVQGIRTLQEAYGPIGRLTVVLEGEDTASLEAAADALGEDLRGVEHVRRTEWRRPVEFFEAYRFLYIELEDLESARDRIKKRLKWEKQRANPLFADLAKAEPPEVDFTDIEKKYESKVEVYPFFRSEDTRRYLLFVYFDFGPSNLDMSRDAIADVEVRTRERLADFEGVSYQLTGRYKKRIDQTAMLEADLGNATLVAFSLLMLFLLAYFRSVMAPILVTVPLLMGTIWAFAWAELVFGSLNILTGFLGAVILGLGIDYGIHLMSRYLEARRDGEELRQALKLTISSAGRASVYAGITTVIAFGSLAISHFRAFHEYGIIALGGMTLIILAEVILLPVLLVLVSGTRLEPRIPGDGAARFWSSHSIPGAAKGAMIVVLGLLTAAAVANLGQTRFEYDFQKVFSTDLPSWTLDEEVDEILDLSQIPAVILAESDAHADAIVAEVRSRGDALPEGRTLEAAMTVRDLLPTEQQAKIDVLEELKAEFDRLPRRVIKGEVKTLHDEVVAVLEKGELDRSMLPESLRQPFARIDSESASVVLAFPAVEMHDARDMRDFAVVIRDLPGADDAGSVDAVSEALLMVDILDYVTVDGIWMVSITFLGLLLTAFVAFRRPLRVLVAIGTLTVAIVMALGMVDLFGISFNFVNVLIWPIWLGLGVDAAFHLMIRREESPGDLAGFMGTLGAVAAAFGTSMIGFGAMLLTDHTGLASLGAVAVVGLASIFVASALVQGILFASRRTDVGE